MHEGRGFAKEAAVPLGVSLCPAASPGGGRSAIIGGMTEPQPTPERITTPDGRTLGNARPHLFADHGHLTLVVDTFPQILDELVQGAR